MKKWFKAARLRTLPLSVSGILVGSAYAYYQGYENYTILILALLTTLGLQILSNFANDYGDGVKGTDTNRIGEKRLVASGEITSKQMKNAVVITAIITFIIALLLIYFSFRKENFVLSLIFIFLGIFAIGAAIKYTVGKNAYGYSGFGDVFVFIFFGLVSVLGSNYLYTHILDYKLLLPAFSIGMLSVAVLNLNNMRDIENDKLSNKNTFVVKIGLKNAIIYQRVLIVFAITLMSVFLFILNYNFNALLFSLTLGYFFVHNTIISKAKKYEDFDPELKKIALFTFFCSLYLSLNLIYLANK